MTQAADAFEGMEPDPVTDLGFGGKQIDRRLHIGDELFLLLKCEVSSEKESENSAGKRSFAAGARTTILREVSAAEAARIAAS